MKKFSEITSSDFPGIDKTKFNEWKTAQINSTKNARVAFIILIIINIYTIVVFKSFILGGLLFGIVIFIIYSKPNKLFKDLGITRADIKRARKGEKVEIILDVVTINESSEKKDLIAKHIYCPNCGAELELEEEEYKEKKFTCPECNKFIDMNIYNNNDNERVVTQEEYECSECHTVVKEEDKFCSNCGANLED